MSAGDSSAMSPAIPSSSQRSGLGWKTPAVIVVLIILVVSVVTYVVLTSSGGSPVLGGTGPTQPCGSPGVICGGSKVIANSLVTLVNGSSALTLTVQNTGYGNLITSLQVTLNTSNQVLGSAVTYLKPGNQTTVRYLLTPDEIQISPGKTYAFFLNAWDGTSEDSSSLFMVVASQQTTATTSTS